MQACLRIAGWETQTECLVVQCMRNFNLHDHRELKQVTSTADASFLHRGSRDFVLCLRCARKALSLRKALSDAEIDVSQLVPCLDLRDRVHAIHPSLKPRDGNQCENKTKHACKLQAGCRDYWI